MPENVQSYISSLETKVETLTEKLRLALYRKFGRSSEKTDSFQQDLFEETVQEADKPQEEETITVPTYRRKKAGRKPLDENIPRERIVHDISEEEKICGCGKHLAHIDDVVIEKLQIIPEQVFVEQHVYPKYACRHCEGSGDEDKPVFRKV